MTSWQLTRNGAPADPIGPEVVLDPAEQLEFRLRAAGTELLVPPLDELEIYGGLPAVPDATLAIHYEVVGTPIGTVRVVLELTDGRMTRSASVAEFEVTELPLVTVSIEWARHLEWRRGECTVLEALEGAAIEARWQVMLLAHGLLQQPEWTGPLRALPAVSP